MWAEELPAGVDVEAVSELRNKLLKKKLTGPKRRVWAIFVIESWWFVVTSHVRGGY